NQILYVAGADVGVTKQFTFALDLLGQQVRNAQKVVPSTFIGANQVGYQQIAFRKGTLNELNGAAGFKINAFGKLIVAFNVLFKLNNDGLRGKVTPLIGLSYTL
ncbi:MAG: hypothetical protein ABI822_19195, partial [Bryobacteraceae bacterium]